MFKAQISASILKDALESIAILGDEVTLKISDTRLNCCIVDQANVAMVRLELSKEAFMSYEATETQIAIGLLNLMGKLEIADKDDTIELNLDEVKHCLNIAIGKFSYSVQLLDPAGIRKEPKIPALNHDATITMKGELLKKPIKAIEKMSDIIKLAVLNNVFRMESDGNQDTGKAELSDEVIITCNSSKELISQYSMDYLVDMVRVVSKLPDVHIGLGTNYPLQLTAKIAGDKGDLFYLLAPRVDQD